MIASGGAGTPQHLADALETGAEAALAASIFHDGTHSVEEVKAVCRAARAVDAVSLDPTALNYDDDGLVTCVCQDAATGDVLMVAWATREAIERTLETGRATFWSRSRGELWQKGATSGNVLALVELRADCDGDTVLMRVTPSGPACHTGAETCFGPRTSLHGEPRAHDHGAARRRSGVELRRSHPGCATRARRTQGR